MSQGTFENNLPATTRPNMSPLPTLVLFTLPSVFLLLSVSLAQCLLSTAFCTSGQFSLRHVCSGSTVVIGRSLVIKMSASPLTSAAATGGGPPMHDGTLIIDRWRLIDGEEDHITQREFWYNITRMCVRTQSAILCRLHCWCLLHASFSLSCLLPLIDGSVDSNLYSAIIWSFVIAVLWCLPSFHVVIPCSQAQCAEHIDNVWEKREKKKI